MYGREDATGSVIGKSGSGRNVGGTWMQSSICRNPSWPRQVRLAPFENVNGTSCTPKRPISNISIVCNLTKLASRIYVYDKAVHFFLTNDAIFDLCDDKVGNR